MKSSHLMHVSGCKRAKKLRRYSASLLPEMCLVCKLIAMAANIRPGHISMQDVEADHQSLAQTLSVLGNVVRSDSDSIDSFREVNQHLHKLCQRDAYSLPEVAWHVVWPRHLPISPSSSSIYHHYAVVLTDQAKVLLSQHPYSTCSCAHLSIYSGNIRTENAMH